jgi:hypothetical protein
MANRFIGTIGLQRNRRFGNRRVQSFEVDHLVCVVRNQPFGSLGGDDEHRGSVQMSVSHTGYRIGGSRAQGGQARRRHAGKAGRRRCHEDGRGLAMDENEANLVTTKGIEDFYRFAAGQAEDDIDSSPLKLFSQDIGYCFHESILS